MDESFLSDLLGSFQPIKNPDSVILGIQPTPLPGTTKYLYVGAFSFLEDVLSIGMLFSIFSNQKLHFLSYLTCGYICPL